MNRGEEKIPKYNFENDVHSYHTMMLLKRMIQYYCRISGLTSLPREWVREWVNVNYKYRVSSKNVDDVIMAYSKYVDKKIDSKNCFPIVFGAIK